jgi:hypothetical protein
MNELVSKVGRWKLRHGGKKKRLTVDSIDPLMDLLSGSSSPT